MILLLHLISSELTLFNNDDHLSASGHLDLGHVLRPVGEHVHVHIETNEEVLLCRLQEVFQEHDVPVQKVTGVTSKSKVIPEMLHLGWDGNLSVGMSYLLSNSEHSDCHADVLRLVDAVE